MKREKFFGGKNQVLVEIEGKKKYRFNCRKKLLKNQIVKTKIVEKNICIIDCT